LFKVKHNRLKGGYFGKPKSHEEYADFFGELIEKQNKPYIENDI